MTYGECERCGREIGEEYSIAEHSHCYTCRDWLDEIEGRK